MFKYLIIFAQIFIIFSVHGKVLSFDITRPRVIDFDYKMVCKELGNSYPIIINEAGPVNLDCMGDIVNVNEFCQKKFKDEVGFLRGIVSKKNKLVYCQFGKEAILSLSCDKSHQSYCQNPKNGCMRLKSIYAFNLDLVHYSLIEESALNKISCYYETKLSEKEMMNLKKDLSGK